jgi:hypothetical protein
MMPNELETDKEGPKAFEFKLSKIFRIRQVMKNKRRPGGTLRVIFVGGA